MRQFGEAPPPLTLFERLKEGLSRSTSGLSDSITGIFTNRKLEFNRHELIQLLRWNGSGLSYDRVETSLDRWTSVYLKYENAWRDNRTKTWTTTGFHIIDAYQLNDSRSSDAQLGLIPSYIIWGQDIFESFQAGYLKPLDYDLCMGLKNSTAKRMYRFLDKRFYTSPVVAMDLVEFACGHIGLTESNNVAILKRRLAPAIAELEGIRFIVREDPGQRYRKVRPGVWRVEFKPGRAELAADADDDNRMSSAAAGSTSAARLAAEYYRLWDPALPVQGVLV